MKSLAAITVVLVVVFLATGGVLAIAHELRSRRNDELGLPAPLSSNHRGLVGLGAALIGVAGVMTAL